MEMLASYFDESGSHEGARALVVCGLVSTLERWVQFEKDWNEILSLPQFDLEYMHMKEFRGYEGRFAKFKNDLSLQTDLFRRLQSLIRAATLHTVNCTLLTDAYAPVNAEYQVDEVYGRPIALCSQVALSHIGHWAARTNRTQDQMAYVCFQGMKDWEHISKKWFDLAGVCPSAADSCTAPALQAADHLAWESHRAITEILSKGFGGGLKFRGAFAALMEQFGEDDWEILDESNLRSRCEASGVPKR
jgi:hypothetical protein